MATRHVSAVRPPSRLLSSATEITSRVDRRAGVAHYVALHYQYDERSRPFVRHRRPSH